MYDAESPSHVLLPIFARERNRVENPLAFSRSHVESANVALDVRSALGDAAHKVRGADDDHVFGDDGCGMEPDVAVNQIHVLIVVELQIDDAVLAEAGYKSSRLRVKSDEAVSRRHVQNSGVPSVGPVREAAPGQPPRRRVATRAFVLAVHPQHLAGCRVERDDRAPRAGRGEQHATNHQRSRLEIEFRTRAERIGLEPPRHFEFVEVGRSDLGERGIPRAGEVAAVGSPFDRRRPQAGRLAGQSAVRRGHHRAEQDQKGSEETTRLRHYGASR